MRIVVSGATGNTGKPCALALARAGHQVIAITRDKSGAVAQELALNPNIQVVVLDDAFKQPVDRLFLVSRLGSFEDETELIRLAKEAGVKYIVKIATAERSMKDLYSKIAASRSHQAVELYLEHGVIPWTSLRPNAFFPFIGVDFGSIATTKQFKFLFGNNSVAGVDPVDIGEIAAALLGLEDPSPHYGKRYEISGPKDLNIPAIVEAYKKVLGIDVEGKPFTRDELIAMYGMFVTNNVEKIVDALSELFENNPADTQHSKTAPELLKLVPVKRDFETFLRKLYGK